MLFTKRSVVLSVAALGNLAQADYMDNARTGAKVLQQWYNQKTGLWDTTGWWNGANCLTALADLDSIDKSSSFTDVYENTFNKAQSSPMRMAKRHVNGVVETTYTMLSNTQLQRRGFKGFVNEYFDDMGWWALAWIRVWDNTHNDKYLAMAQSIFQNMAETGWGTRCSSGGVWWNREKKVVNAIPNELFLSVASGLAVRAGSVPGGPSKKFYVDWAIKEWTWFKGTGMINEQNTINDGLNDQCKNNKARVWSYNQGVILGGLVDLAEATGDQSYVQTALTIAHAAIKELGDKNGVLHDTCEPCGGDVSQFKGVLSRNVRILYQKTKDAGLRKFIDVNADSNWKANRNEKNQFGYIWSKLLVSTEADKGPNASTHSSALDSIIAAAAAAQVGPPPVESSSSTTRSSTSSSTPSSTRASVSSSSAVATTTSTSAQPPATTTSVSSSPSGTAVSSSFVTSATASAGSSSEIAQVSSSSSVDSSSTLSSVPVSTPTSTSASLPTSTKAVHACRARHTKVV